MGAYLTCGGYHGGACTSTVVRSAHTITASIMNRNSGSWRLDRIGAWMVRFGLGGLIFQQVCFTRKGDVENAVRRTECLVQIYIWWLQGSRYVLLLGLPMVFEGSGNMSIWLSILGIYLV